MRAAATALGAGSRGDPDGRATVQWVEVGAGRQRHVAQRRPLKNQSTDRSRDLSSR